jgi:uncharacterized protein
MENSQKILFLRRNIPAFACKPGCHDCCGPVTASPTEVARLPPKTEAEHDIALAELNCPYLGKNGCEVYNERPLICRLFGTTPKLLCPHGQKPEQMINPRIEQKVNRYLVETRQVLI